MTENKAELIKLILESDNLEQAVLTVADIISCFSKQHGSTQGRVVADLQLIYQMSREM